MKTLSCILVLFLLESNLMAQSPSGGLVAYYQLNGNAVDLTGNGNNGVITGGVSLASDRFGNLSSALRFDGTGYITVNNSPSLQLGRQFTIACWFNIIEQAPNTWEGLVTKTYATTGYDAGPRAMVSRSTYGILNFPTMATPPYDTAKAVPLEMAHWYHYTLTGNGDSVREYLNGELKMVFPQDYNWTFSTTYPLTLGAQVGNFDGRNLNGILDEVRIYNRPLSKSEVFTLYSGVSPIGVSLPDTIGVGGDTIDIPVSVGDLTGENVLSYQFTLKFNTPDSILSIAADAITAGTLSGTAEWTTILNTSVPNQVTVGAIGTSAIHGAGVLLKLRFHVNGAAYNGQVANLQVTDFTFNAGSPSSSVVDGRIAISDLNCGDADENGVVQAYDASVTLREAVGPMPSPPPPLTAQGRANADVDKNGSIQAYDAALILRHVVGLPMPEGVVTCFNDFGKPGAIESTIGNLQIVNTGKSQEGGVSALVLKLSGIKATDNIYAVSFDLSIARSGDPSPALPTLLLPKEYLFNINQLNEQRFRIGIINARGINADDIKLMLSGNRSESIGEIRCSNILLNSSKVPDILISNSQNSLVPARYDLIGAYPNPFNPSSEIVFELRESARVTLEIYNIIGMRIRTLVHQDMEGGRHEVMWDGLNEAGQHVSSGQYFCRMNAGTFSKTIRLMPLK